MGNFSNYSIPISVLCSSIKYPYLPYGSYFYKNPHPHPSGNSNFTPMISLNFLVFENQEIPIPSLRGVWIFCGTTRSLLEWLPCDWLIESLLTDRQTYWIAWLTHSLTHSLTPSLPPSLTHSLTHSLIEHEQHFLLHCQGYATIRRELHSCILNADAHYANLNDNERTKYKLSADNKATAKIMGKCIHLMFQRWKLILNAQM